MTVLGHSWHFVRVKKDQGSAQILKNVTNDL